MVATTEAKVELAHTTTVVHHNTQFERGHALEVFFFKTDDAGTRLDMYNYQVGKRIWCPALAVTSGCSIENAPVSVP